LPNAKLTHGSLKPAGGCKSERGEGAEAAEAASVTEPVELWPHFSTTRAESRWCAASGSAIQAAAIIFFLRSSYSISEIKFFDRRSSNWRRRSSIEIWMVVLVLETAREEARLKEPKRSTRMPPTNNEMARVSMPPKARIDCETREVHWTIPKTMSKSPIIGAIIPNSLDFQISLLKSKNSSKQSSQGGPLIKVIFATCSWLHNGHCLGGGHPSSIWKCFLHPKQIY